MFFPSSFDIPPPPHTIIHLHCVQHQWLWSGADLNREIDLGADAFLPEKKLLHATDNIKMLKVKHKTQGDVVFTLLQDQTKLWKICNVAVFGDTSQEASQEALISATIAPEKVNVALGSLLDILNDKVSTPLSTLSI